MRQLYENEPITGNQAQDHERADSGVHAAVGLKPSVKFASAIPYLLDLSRT
jgi:hypothetical protein